MAEDHDFQQRVQQLETRLQEVERLADPAARAQIREIVQTLLDLHGTGFERVLEHIAAAGEPGRSIIDTLSNDDLVGSLLLLYGLHPLDLETRVRRALDKLQSSPGSRGNHVELLEITAGVVRLRVEAEADGHGCHSSSRNLKRMIEDAIYEKAPDIAALEIEGVTEPASAPSSTFVPVEQVLLKNGQPRQGEDLTFNLRRTNDDPSFAAGAVPRAGHP